ncbi:saccharopine dehydrogenase NADP-binding domain-containing protein [Fibrella sp. HMF5335]|uniref:Saccharopine dehydrogenase NADP-binding domain-containing protein n=1 Tax=Fibrella rubiginis TaxID=2817060 RepID=A0A939GEI7_9BACT|nr:saccharopine dehydrogenase NADP-binding domain-containing protein [Fibrella rubiginis]MBO0937662.1 saccharopine dehydrogenase NADP-binding domain-containing protein [Fibrella rubiginis]
MNPPNTFLLYGATGYTARLILEKVGQFGLKPILCGRDEAKLRPLAGQFGFDYRVADLTNAAALDAALQGVPVVLHCAGPFSKTALPMQQACLRNRVHYLDITGEVAVFEQGAALDVAAKQQGVMLMSGVGFDVVPTDCIARYLKDKLPDATHLELAFANDGGAVSHGTAQTAADGLGQGGLVRENGKLKRVDYAHKVLTVKFLNGQTATCMSIPWGDVSTAYHTTGIPNIETFMAAEPMAIRLARAGNYLGWLLRQKWVQRFVQQQITKRITGPDEAKRSGANTQVWGRARNAAGTVTEARLSGPDGYDMTVLASLLITKKVLHGQFKPGFQTPAGLFGADLVLEIGGVKREAN